MYSVYGDRPFHPSKTTLWLFVMLGLLTSQTLFQLTWYTHITWVKSLTCYGASGTNGTIWAIWTREKEFCLKTLTQPWMEELVVWFPKRCQGPKGLSWLFQSVHMFHSRMEILRSQLYPEKASKSVLWCFMNGLHDAIRGFSSKSFDGFEKNRSFKCLGRLRYDLTVTIRHFDHTIHGCNWSTRSNVGAQKHKAGRSRPRPAPQLIEVPNRQWQSQPKKSTILMYPSCLSRSQRDFGGSRPQSRAEWYPTLAWGRGKPVQFYMHFWECNTSLRKANVLCRAALKVDPGLVSESPEMRRFPEISLLISLIERIADGLKVRSLSCIQNFWWRKQMVNSMDFH